MSNWGKVMSGSNDGDGGPPKRLLSLAERLAGTWTRAEETEEDKVPKLAYIVKLTQAVKKEEKRMPPAVSAKLAIERAQENEKDNAIYLAESGNVLAQSNDVFSHLAPADETKHNELTTIKAALQFYNRKHALEMQSTGDQDATGEATERKRVSFSEDTVENEGKTEQIKEEKERERREEAGEEEEEEEEDDDDDDDDDDEDDDEEEEELDPIMRRLRLMQRKKKMAKKKKSSTQS